MRTLPRFLVKFTDRRDENDGLNVLKFRHVFRSKHSFAYVKAMDPFPPFRATSSHIEHPKIDFLYPIGNLKIIVES